MITQKHIDKFWRKIDKKGSDECWEWIAGRTKAGYGITKTNGEYHLGHRLSWMIHNGDIPKGLFVCHSCDNPGCCNPQHLWLGTPHDNVIDAITKGRQKGVLDISIRRYKVIEAVLIGEYRNHSEVARVFNISRQRVSQIVKSATITDMNIIANDAKLPNPHRRQP